MCTPTADESSSPSSGPPVTGGRMGTAARRVPAAARELAVLLGLRPFDLDDDARAAYHAGAAVASNYLVTLRSAARSLLEAAGAPPEALDPLIRGVVDSGFELTGPIARGDWATVERHLEIIRAERPELEDLYRVLAAQTARIAGREIPSNSLLQDAGRR